MSKISSLYNHYENLYSLNIETNKLESINNDLKNSDPNFIPAKNWMNVNENIEKSPSELKLDIDKLLYDFCGYAKQVITDVDIFWWQSSLKNIDTLEIYNDVFKEKINYQKLTVSDLGFFWDLNLINSYLNYKKDTIKIIEVGGGYGRLAEICQYVLPGKVKYYLVDAVPATLCLAYEYLKKALPDHKVGTYYEDENILNKDLDLYILPSWKCNLLPLESFDLAINIQSMQEMYKHHIDFYFDLFNKSLKKDGLIYLCNRRDYLYKDSWDLPENWQCLQKRKSPRSWIREMPAELYQKLSRNARKSQYLADAFYERELNNSDNKKLQEATLKGYKSY